MFKPDGTSELRGHHVSNIGEFYFILHRHNPEAKLDVPKEYKPPLLCPWVKKPLFGQEVYRAVILGGGLTIKVTNTSDVICAGGKNHLSCKKKTPDCENDLRGSDNYCLDEYGLSVGEVVTSGEIMRRIVEYRERTGVVSPRSRCGE